MVPVFMLTTACTGFWGPLLTCPESARVGESFELIATQVDDALVWTILDNDETQAVIVLADGSEVESGTTSVLGDPGRATGTAVIAIRAERIGTLRVVAEETTIGPGLSLLPRRMGSAECTIKVLE